MAAPRAFHGLVAVVGANLVALSLTTCQPERSLCARVACHARQVCDESTGRCVVPDAGLLGVADAGSCDPSCPATQRCDTATHRCVDCLDSSQCACPTPVCSSALTCVEASGEAGINVGAGGERCADAPTIETCTSALHFTADLGAAGDDAEASCAAPASGGGDVVYALKLTTTADVRVTASASVGSRAAPVVSVRTTCEFFSELGCAATGASSTLHLKSLAPATYLLFIDAVDARATGRVDVTVEFLAPTTPLNETCGTAAALPLDGTSVPVALQSADDDLGVPCNHTVNSPDLVYQFTATEPSSLLVTTSAGVDSVLSLKEAPCLAGASIACVNDSNATQGERLQVPRLPAGTYFLIVEAVGHATQGLVLSATLGAPKDVPSNDTCATPAPITFVQGEATFIADTSAATDNVTSSCSLTQSSPELTYELVLTEAHTITVVAQGAEGASVRPVLSLRVGACEGIGVDESACAAAPGPDLVATITARLDAGTSYLLVEGPSSGAGLTRVRVTILP